MKNNTKFNHTVILIKKSLLGFFLMLIISPTSNADQNLAVFEPMDVFDLEWATDPRVSPDGKTIVYVRKSCLLYTSPSPRDATLSRMPSSA